MIFYPPMGENFVADIKRIKEYILEGDVMQVVLSQRMSVPFESDPLNFYRVALTKSITLYVFP